LEVAIDVLEHVADVIGWRNEIEARTATVAGRPTLG
jgi:hypothetical protein